MVRFNKNGKYKTYYYLEVDNIFNVEDRTIMETQFVEKCLDDMNIDLESEDNNDIILSKRQMIYLLTGIVRQWDIFKEKPSFDLNTSPKPKEMTRKERTEYNDLNYIKLKDILSTDEILTSIEIDEPEKIKFIRDYLNNRLQVDIEKDDLIVFEPIDTNYVILLIYDIVKTFENETQES